MSVQHSDLEMAHNQAQNDEVSRKPLLTFLVSQLGLSRQRRITLWRL